MAKETRHPLKTIGFRVYLHNRGRANDTAKGNVVLLDADGLQTYGKSGQRTFNHWDEIPKAMRKLIADCLKLKKKQRGNRWRYEPRSTTR